MLRLKESLLFHGEKYLVDVLRTPHPFLKLGLELLFLIWDCAFLQILLGVSKSKTPTRDRLLQLQASSSKQ